MDISSLLLSLLDGVDPTTGEVFDVSILSSDPDISRSIMTLALLTQHDVNWKKPFSINRLNRPVEAIFNDLKSWRFNEAAILGLPAYYVFSDNELYQIAMSDITSKEQLICVRGINEKRYELYASAIWEIISQYI